MRPVRLAIHLMGVSAVFLVALNVVPMPASAALGPTPDATATTNGVIWTTIRDGNYIYIGGQFTKVKPPIGVGGAGFDVNGLARIDAATGLGDPSWTPDVTWGSFVTSKKPAVRAMAAAGGRIWIGGEFGAVDGQPRTNFAAIDAATGAVDPSVTASVGTLGSNSIRAMAASSSLVYAGGYFKDVNGVPRRFLAAFRLDGTLDDTWQTKTNKRVFSMAWDCTGSTLFVGGQFRSVRVPGGDWVARDTVVRLDPTTGGIDAWAIPAGTIELDQKAYALAPTCTQLNVGYGGRNYAAAFTLTNGSTGMQMWRDTTTGNVQAIAAVGDQVVFGGHFTSVKGVSRVRIAAASAATGVLDPNWHPNIEGQWGGPWGMLVSDNYLYVVGQFTLVAGVSQTFFARFTF